MMKIYCVRFSLINKNWLKYSKVKETQQDALVSLRKLSCGCAGIFLLCVHTRFPVHYSHHYSFSQL